MWPMAYGACSSPISFCFAVPERVTRCRPLLGTFVEITADCGVAIDEAFDAVARVHRLMSAHEADSDVSQINRFAHAEPVEVDPWTALVIGRAIRWSVLSAGAFDVVRAGKSAREAGLIPAHPGQPEPLASAFHALDLHGNTVRLKTAGCIDLGGIAKGFAVDQAVEALKAGGAIAGLVNAGGDAAGFGSDPWPVDVVRPTDRTPIARVRLENSAIATSAVHLDGNSSHLPGASRDLLSATVNAPAAMDADALTKIVLSQGAAVGQCLAIAKASAFVLDRRGAIREVEADRQAA